MSITRVAVMGAGWVGLSILCDLTRRGYNVNLWNHRSERIAPIVEKRQVEVVDPEGEFIVELNAETKISTEVEDVVEGCNLVISAVPAFAQKDLTIRLAPQLKDNQILLFLAGSCGSLEAAKALRDLRFDKEITLAEGMLPPQNGRVIRPGRIRAASTLIREKKISPEKPRRFAAFPAERTCEALRIVEEIYRYRAAKNVLEVGLLNVNFVIHPAPYVLNIATIERTNGDISLLPEGMSASVLRVMDTMDKEKIQLCKALRIDPISCDALYLEMGREPAYRQRQNPMGFRDRIPDVRASRYIAEDVPYGSVMWASFGDMVGVETPMTDAIIKLASTIQDVDYIKTGRTTDKLGVSGMTVDELERYLTEGIA